MFGECHAHIIMNGVNYRQAIDMHKYGPDGQIIREHLKAYQDRELLSFVTVVMRWGFP